uniref:WD repeat and FYVE domain-containing protein 3 (Trinotate prediction) n=1 Tax=Henneguya salminicola TaxID=69463 RepID=A0A6G3MFB2_HENSL
MFNNVKDLWSSSAINSPADVKELLPEFYYTHEFLINSNQFLFGEKQNGTTVENVKLPPWARGDPKEFIRLNRAALESEYVSSNINNWIDLIFGYKQTGKNAIKSNNVFHSWFYKGSVNLQNVSDTTIKKSIISFINNFGQIPKKLFGEPHPKRKTLVSENYNTNNIFLCDKTIINLHTQFFNLLIKNIETCGTSFLVCFENQIFVPPYCNSKLCWQRLDGHLSLIDCDKDKQMNIKILNTNTYHGQITASCFLNVLYVAFGCITGVIIYFFELENFHLEI